MPARRDVGDQIDFALRRHFSARFTEEQRAEVVERIRTWDAEHPDLDRSARTEGWLALARAELSGPTVFPVPAVAVSGMRG